MPLRPLHALGFCVAVVLCILAIQGSANAIQDCCLQVPCQPKPFSRRMQNQLVSYRTQGPQTGCLREAIVFITKKERELCICRDADWALELMKKIDARKRKARAGHLRV